MQDGEGRVGRAGAVAARRVPVWVWWAAWGLAFCVMVAGSLNPLTRPPAAHGIDKFSHLLGYAALALIPAIRLPRVAAAAAAALFLFAAGGLVEVLQSQVPGRMGSLADAAMNGIGAAAGLAAGRLLRARPAPPGRHPLGHRPDQ